MIDPYEDFSDDDSYGPSPFWQGLGWVVGVVLITLVLATFVYQVWLEFFGRM